MEFIPTEKMVTASLDIYKKRLDESMENRSADEDGSRKFVVEELDSSSTDHPDLDGI